MKKQPFNIYSIEDIEAWRSTFFHPLPMTTHRVVDQKICNLLTKEYLTIKPEQQIHYRIAIGHLHQDTLRMLMLLIAAQKMKEYDQVEFVFNNHRCPDKTQLPAKSYIFDLYQGQHDLDFPKLSLNFIDEFYQNIPRWRKIGRQVKIKWKQRELKNVEETRSLVMNPNHCTRRYIKLHLDVSPYLLHPLEVFNMRKPSMSKHHSDFSAFAAKIASKVEDIYHEITKSRIPSQILQRYKVHVAYYFNRVDWELNQARKFCAKLPAEVKLYTGTAKHFTRIISEAIRERGGQVTGFPHEGGLAGLVFPSLAFREFATCDRFACFSQKEADDYRKYSLINEIEFLMVPTLGESILQIEQKRFKASETIDPANISNIIYVDGGLFHDNFHALPSDTQKLDLQLRIIDILRETNKQIIYKNRAKNKYPALGQGYKHLDYFAGEIEYDSTPLSKMLDQADLLILEAIGSTALYEVMTLTKTPIILFKPHVPECSPRFEEILAKRCYVIDLCEDERNQLCFDEAKLRKMLQLS